MGMSISTVAPDTCGSCGRGKAVAHTACHTGLRAPRRPVARVVQSVVGFTQSAKRECRHPPCGWQVSCPSNP